MKSADSDPDHEISISVLEPRQEETNNSYKGKQRNNRRTKQSKRQTSIPVKRRRREIRTKTQKGKQITAEIKTGKQQGAFERTRK